MSGSMTGIESTGLSGFQITQGMPALRVPHGQILLNQCASTKYGRRIARTKSDTYFPYLKPGWILNFLLLILYVWSCIHPNGQSHPQTERPKTIPIAPRNPINAKGILPIALKC
jgi:hypothetical protein